MAYISALIRLVMIHMFVNWEGSSIELKKRTHVDYKEVTLVDYKELL